MQLCNPNASAAAVRLYAYLQEIAGKAVILGQHTQTRKQEELTYIKKVTGKQPALCGFELLSYSGNINWDSCDEECYRELYENFGTVENALNWGRKGGIVTLTWHWYSPVGGKDKSFFSHNTELNPETVLAEGSRAHLAMCRDLDLIAVQLERFRQEGIPVLWRPFHESEGTWFWWSKNGPETAKRLYRFMYEYFTVQKQLNNLIWVWNSPLMEGYPGDDVVDIISRDLYPPAHEHTAQAEAYHQLKSITQEKKPCAIAEIGTQPDVDAVIAREIPWCWFMSWSRVYALTEDFTDHAQLGRNYGSSHAITLDRLPKLYPISGEACV